VKASLNIFCSSPQKILSINRYNQIKNHLAYSDDIEGKYDKESVSTYLEKFKDVLDEEEYKFLVLHLIYGFTFREIAKANDLTTSQVSSKYQRGIKKLRDYYGGK
jgi:RNA polymerase sigma-70 factor (ECF subfamily)